MPNREDMARLMSKRLPKQMMAFLLACGVQGESHGFHVHLVGGMVRDVLRDRPPGDPDLVVQETVPTMDAAARFGALLAEALGGRVSAPSQFGTVKLEAGGLTVDVATARRETYESPGALPSVRPATIDGDMDRRDFTVNAISVDLAPGRFGTILDHHGGVDDVSGGFLVVLHDRSFSDDPTRALRAIRYEARLRLHMSMVTEDMVRRNLGHMDAVSGDRVRHEFERIFAGTCAGSGPRPRGRARSASGGAAGTHLERGHERGGPGDAGRRAVPWYGGTDGAPRAAGVAAIAGRRRAAHRAAERAEAVGKGHRGHRVGLGAAAALRPYGHFAVRRLRHAGGRVAGGRARVGRAVHRRRRKPPARLPRQASTRPNAAHRRRPVGARRGGGPARRRAAAGSCWTRGSTATSPRVETRKRWCAAACRRSRNSA